MKYKVDKAPSLGVLNAVISAERAKDARGTYDLSVLLVLADKWITAQSSLHDLHYCFPDQRALAWPKMESKSWSGTALYKHLVEVGYLREAGNLLVALNAVATCIDCHEAYDQRDFHSLDDKLDEFLMSHEEETIKTEHYGFVFFRREDDGGWMLCRPKWQRAEDMAVHMEFVEKITARKVPQVITEERL